MQCKPLCTDAQESAQRSATLHAQLDFPHGDADLDAARPVDLPAADRSDQTGLLLRSVLRLHQGTARGRRPPPPRLDAGVPEEGVGPRRHRRGDRGAEAVLGARARTRRMGAGLERPRGACVARGRPDHPARDRDDDRGRLQPVRPPRDRVPRVARAPVADHAQRARGRRGGSRQADLLLPGSSRPLARPDRRWLERARGRRDRRVHRRAGLVVGRAWDRHRPARADRRLRRRHGQGGARCSPTATTTR